MSRNSRYLRPEEWIATWMRAGPALEAVRRRELQQVDLRAFLRETADMSLALSATPRSTSGLVEQQRWFRRLAG